MKTLQIFMAVLFFTAFSSCSNDDDNNDQTPQTETWNLTHVVGGFAGVDQTFPSGLVMWTFNSDTQMVVVVNNNTDDTLFDFFDSGSYSYTIVNDGTDDMITIDGMELGTLTELPNEIIIDQQVLDGFRLTLTR